MLSADLLHSLQIPLIVSYQLLLHPEKYNVQCYKDK